ncbi:hypothetical protein F511_43748 [Dorcoceras hygrometricum]|uniref:Uncharacterized protein n=1 Tax=Dorcoceras hygrometricum TaxID=472368 RepID=A0A2Z7BK50_9LAMI|nr:hypothetical protein F511_43748 [Dorcoceras hygrometricum]
MKSRSSCNSGWSQAQVASKLPHRETGSGSATVSPTELPVVFSVVGPGLAMETSKVESVVRNQAEAKLNQLEHSEPAGTIRTSCKR